jgi:CBS domain-containing protein
MICPNCGFDNVPGSEECASCEQDLTHLDRPDPRDRIEQSLLLDTVRDLGPAKPVQILPSETLQEALGTMALHNVGAVLVVNEKDLILGILSERDILNRVCGLIPDYQKLYVRDFMTPNPVTVAPDEKLAFALHKMDVGGYRHLPVVENLHPVGMISVRDLLRYVARLIKSS